MFTNHSVHPASVWGYPSWRVDCRRVDLRRVDKFTWQRKLGDVADLRAAGHHVALAAAHFAHRDGTRMFAGERRLAQFCRRSVRHVRTQLRDLVAAGYLRRMTHGGGRPRAGQKRAYGARYELTLPAHLVDTADDSTAGDGSTSMFGSTSRPATEPVAATTRWPQDTGGGRSVGEQIVDKLREVLARPTMTATEADRIATTVLAAAAQPVRHPARYVLTSVERDPRRWRPTPTVGDPCGVHPDHLAAGCPRCREAPPASPAAIRRARRAARNDRAP